ncbi:MAG TPA: hypothetical protein IAC41_01400 [Candidatus Merdenecus merdavium]|nr:hypothetical protein [Candidatus Merdenecus merdavium]
MELKERCRNFVAELNLPITAFCKNVAISPSFYYKWQRGERIMASDKVKRIDKYLQKYGF